MEHRAKRWDFFLAHATPDREVAESLYKQLASDFHVFLDHHSLVPGDDWDRAVTEAQENSRITIVIVSSKTAAAYYQREEIAAAIALARADTKGHRVVPVFLDDKARDNTAVPYGLRLKNSISVSALGGLDCVAPFLKRTLAPTLAMSKREILSRYKKRTVVEIGLRLIPSDDLKNTASLGLSHRKYVFIGDYEEQRFRTLNEVLKNLLIGDSFEKIQNSNVEWTAIRFKVGNSNYRKLDVFPATWKAAFRLLSDPSRLGLFRASAEEEERMGRGSLRDYMSGDQDYWYGRLTVPQRRYANNGSDSFLIDDLGISNLCFNGSGLTKGTVPSRLFFVKNFLTADLKKKVIPLGFPSDNVILL